MPRPDPEFASFIMQAMMAQDPSATFTATDGLLYQVELDPDPGMHRRARPTNAGPGQGGEFINWKASQSRPDAYPVEAPFLPGLPILTVGRSEPQPMRFTVFTTVAGSTEIVDRLLATGREAGWEDVAMPADYPPLLGNAHQQRRGSSSRMILVAPGSQSSGGVIVMDLPALPTMPNQAA